MSKMDNLKVALHNILHEKYHYPSFRPGQEETLISVMQEKPTLAVLPTGAGKSLLYQLPAYLTTGLIVVVSPLISLMQDQVDRLRENGSFKVAVLNSSLDYRQQKAVLSSLQQYRFVFTSPETLTKPTVRKRLRELGVSLFVVDEAHCISQWGPNFRPEYLLIQEVISEVQPQRLLLLTATATPAVADDIIKKIGLTVDKVHVVRESVDRPNIFLAVKRLASDDEKRDYLLRQLTALGPGGVIYFSSKKIAGEVGRLISEHQTLRVGIYHAGLTSIERFQVQQQFMHHQIDLICATSAFGMGINKNDLRYVIHYHMPGSLESYVQEFGRAGRDGKTALALLLYTPGDEYLQEILGKTAIPTRKLMMKVKQHQAPKQVLGDEQELLSFYLDHQYPLPKIEEILKEQNQLSHRRLLQMLEYVNSEHCYRELISQYFGESIDERPKRCCSIGTPDWQVTDLQLDPVAKVNDDHQLDWRTTINQLFQS